MRVGLTFNLKKPNADPADEISAEWDEPQTIQSITDALASEHDVVPVIADPDAYHKLRTSSLDIVFNIAEGCRGPNREAHVPSLLEFLALPYTGSDPFTLSACLDKVRAKEILVAHGIPTPAFHVVSDPGALNWRGGYPAIVKPRWEGSSIGIHDASWVENARQLRERVHRICTELRQPALIEEALNGREFTVALLGNGDGLRVLPLVELNFDALPPYAHPIYSYEAKWIWDVKEKPLKIFECPAVVEDALRVKIEHTARAAFLALGCKDWCRIDVRLDRCGLPMVLELNPIPGILPDPSQNSCFPKAARAAGLSYRETILSVLDEAIKRYGMMETVPAARSR